jgi:hypothetical protein
MSGVVGPRFGNQYSVAFDGTDDYIDLGSTTTGNSGQFTLSFWIKGGAASLSGFTYLFSATPYNLHTYWVVQGTNFQWTNINGVRRNLSIGILDDNWHHILIIWNPDGADQNIRCFTDGTNEVNVTTDFRYARVGGIYNGPLKYIGNRAGQNPGFSGNIDELAIWHSDEELNLSTIYNGGKPSDLTNLNPIGWYRMGDNNGGTGTTVTDQGSGKFNGTLTNDVVFQIDTP